LLKSLQQYCSENKSIFLFGLFLTGIFVLTFLAWSPHIIDDAYITFRFSERIAEGKGITYNDGIRVQGSSTPLWMLLLSFFALIGIPLSFISAALGALFTWLSFGILARISHVVFENAWSGLLASLFATGFFLFIIIAASGMETPLYILVTFALLWCVVDEKWKWIGLLSGILLWIRYDGAITVFLVYLFLLHHQGFKKTFIQGLITLAVYLPWLIFAQIYFGTFIPQTVQTKLLIHYTTWHDLFFIHIKYWFQYTPIWFIWIPMFVIGLFKITNMEKKYWILPAWCIFYAGVFLIRRTPVFNFIWYLIPVFPIFFLISIHGIITVLKFMSEKFNIEKQKKLLLISTFVLLGIIQFIHAQLYHQQFGPQVMQRERAYTLASEGLREHGLQAGDSVLTGEVGAIGYELMEARIIDGYGLVSPEVFEIRKADKQRYEAEGKTPEDYPEGSPQATMDMVEQLEPDFILIQDRYLYIRELYEEGKLDENYQRITGYPFDELGNNIELIVMKRIENES